MFKNKLFVGVLATAVLTPAIVVPIQADAAAKSFKDISKSHDYYKEITEMSKQGIINGYQDGTFKPTQTLSRQHAATLVYRALQQQGIKLTKVKTVNLKDVNTTSEHYTALKALAEADLLTVKNNQVNPEQALTRGEMAKILATAFELKATTRHPLSDVSTAYDDFVSALYEAGITTGDNGKFKENDTLNRQHYAVFLYRAFNYVEQSKTGSTGTSKPPTTETPTSNVVTNEGTVETKKKLEEIRTEHADVFVDDKPIYTTWFDNNPISLKLYENGLDELEKLDMYLHTGNTNEYVSNLLVTFDGYKNPTERYGEAAVIFIGNSDKYGNFNFDFREDKAEQLTLEWLDIAFPQLADELSPLVKEKAQEARENLEDDLHTNMEIINMDGYEIQIGVNTFKEMFVLDIRERM